MDSVDELASVKVDWLPIHEGTQQVGVTDGHPNDQRQFTVSQLAKIVECVAATMSPNSTNVTHDLDQLYTFKQV